MHVCGVSKELIRALHGQQQMKKSYTRTAKISLYESNMLIMLVSFSLMSSLLVAAAWAAEDEEDSRSGAQVQTLHGQRQVQASRVRSLGLVLQSDVSTNLLEQVRAPR